MGDPEALLWRLVAARAEPGADRAAIDAEIRQRFEHAAAVAFTDLVGFSRRTQEFGILHFLGVIHQKRALLWPLVAASGGEILKQEADSWLMVFASADLALATMIEAQRRCAEYNRGVAAEETVELCVGLGYGQLLRIGDHDVWGREVNIASRLGEDTAEGGEILISEAFRQALSADLRDRLVLERLDLADFPGPCWRVGDGGGGVRD